MTSCNLNRDNFISFFQFGRLLFLSLGQLFCLGFPIQWWLEALRADMLSCSRWQRKTFKALTTERDVTRGLFTYGLYYVEVILFYSKLIECFYHERVLNTVICFSSINWHDHVDFPFILRMCCITHYLNSIWWSILAF